MIGAGMFSPVWTHDSREILMVDSPARPGLWRLSGNQGELVSNADFTTGIMKGQFAVFI